MGRAGDNPVSPQPGPRSTTTIETSTPRRTLVYRPQPSVGGRVGAAIAAAAGGIALVAFGLGLTSEPGPAAFLLLLLSSLSLLVAALVGVWTYGYFGLRYTLTPGALLIRWLGGDEAVPLEELDAVYSGQRLGKLGRLRGIAWPGDRVGWARANDRELRVLATSGDPAELTVLVAGRTYAISPTTAWRSARRSFAASTRRTVRCRWRAVAACVLAAEALAEPTPLILLGVGLGIALAVLGRYMLFYAGLPVEVALHFGADGLADLHGPRGALLQLPVLALGGWLVCALAGLSLVGYDRDAARLVWLGCIAAEIVTLVGALRVIA